MARYKIHYKEYPHCAEATEHSLQQAHRGGIIGIFANLLAIMGIVYFVSAVIELFTKGIWLEFFQAFGILVLAAALVFYAYYLHSQITDRECLILIMKKQFSSSAPEDITRLANEIRTATNAKMWQAAKKYFLVFFGGFLIALCATGIVLAIYRLCHGQSGVGLLLSCLAGLGIVIFVLFYSYRHLRAKLESTQVPAAPSQEKSGVVSDQKNIQTDVRFCKTCGTKLLADSIFCAKCGTQVRR